MQTAIFLVPPLLPLSCERGKRRSISFFLLLLRPSSPLFIRAGGEATRFCFLSPPHSHLFIRNKRGGGGQKADVGGGGKATRRKNGKEIANFRLFLLFLLRSHSGRGKAGENGAQKGRRENASEPVDPDGGMASFVRLSRKEENLEEKRTRNEALIRGRAFLDTKVGEGGETEGNCVPRFPRLVARWASLPSLSSRANCDRSRQRHIFCEEKRSFPSLSLSLKNRN